MKHFNLINSIILTLFFVSSLLLAQDTTLTVTGDGNVGIGISNPQQKLHVKGLARFDVGGGQINISTPGNWPGIIAYSQNGHRRDIVVDDIGFRLVTSSTSGPASSGDNGITITEDGNLGIGASNISDKLVVNGNAHVAGKFTSGDAKVSLPIAYGVINADGSVGAATPNVNCIWNSISSRYEIGITEESYHLMNFVTLVQPVGDDPVMIGTNSVGGNLLVKIFNTSGANIQNMFHFVVYKP